jgi:hypothetical protein
MLEDNEIAMLLRYLSLISRKPIRTIDELLSYGTEEFLGLMEKVPDEVLPHCISLFKSTRRGKDFFHKISYDLDETTSPRAQALLRRYMELMLQSHELSDGFNPLIVYLPPACFDDCAFVQSRQSFFLRQTIDTINEFLQTNCGYHGAFEPGCQEEAWAWFWNYLLQK